MLKSLGFIETRSLVGTIAAADIMLKNTDIEIVGKDHLVSGEVILIIQGETSSVNLAIEMGSEKAREIGQLKLSYIIPKPKPELETILNSLLTTASKSTVEPKPEVDAPVKKDQGEKPVQKKNKKLKTKLTEIKMEKAQQKVPEHPIPEIETEQVSETIKETDEPEVHHRVEPFKKVGSKKVKKAIVDENNFSLFEQSNDTISRLRREALGRESLLIEKEPETIVSENRHKSFGEQAKKKHEVPAQNKLEEAIVEFDTAGDLSILNVHKLRKLARGMENFPIKGREISRANREELIDYFKKLK